MPLARMRRSGRFGRTPALVRERGRDRRVRRARSSASSAASSTPDEWRAFRLVRGTYGQRQDGRRPDAAGQDPAGHPRRAAARRARRRRRALLARLRPHHHAPERAVPLREAARRRARDAAAGRGRPHHARGLRQLGAQHHRLPVRRRRAGRGLRRHAVRRGADALPPAPPAELPRCRASSRSPSRAAPRTTPSPRSTTSACARAHVDGSAGAASACTRRRRHVDPAAPRASVLYEFLPAGEILDVAEAVLRVFHRAGRLQAQAAQPHEVPDPRASAGTPGAPSSSARSPRCAPRAARAAVRSRRHPPRAAPAWARPAAPSTRR